jgi:Ca2+-binding EF-hand superfamily protein
MKSEISASHALRASHGLSAWQGEKLRCLFDLLDSDGDGRLEENELEMMLEQLRVDTGWPESSRVVWHVMARCKLFLSSLFRERTALQPDDWLDYFQAVLGADRQNRLGAADYRGPVEEMAHLLFLMLDRDRNDQIDPREFLLFFYALGRRDEDAEASFQRLDRNGDGGLSRGEVEDMALEFFHSTEPGSAGDWLFGPPPGSAEKALESGESPLRTA